MYRSLTMTLAAALMAPMTQAMAEVRLETRASAQVPNIETKLERANRLDQALCQAE